MRYHLFQKFFGKMVKIKETSFLSTRGMILIFGNCTYLHMILLLLCGYVEYVKGKGIANKLNLS